MHTIKTSEELCPCTMKNSTPLVVILMMRRYETIQCRIFFADPRYSSVLTIGIVKLLKCSIFFTGPRYYSVLTIGIVKLMKQSGIQNAAAPLIPVCGDYLANRTLASITS